MSKVKIAVDEGTWYRFMEVEDVRPEHIKRFRRYAEQLNKLIDEIREYCPYAHYYHSVDTLNLMRGDSHTGSAGRVRFNHVVSSVTLRHSESGDW